VGQDKIPPHDSTANWRFSVIQGRHEQAVLSTIRALRVRRFTLRGIAAELNERDYRQMR